MKIRVQVPQNWTEECDHTFNVKLKQGYDSGTKPQKNIAPGRGVHFKVCIKIPPAEEPSPSISIDKSANVTMAHVGDMIRYFYNVTNTGNVQLTNIYIDDNVTGTINVADTLDPNEWILVHYDYTVKATDLDPLINNATVYAKYNDQQEVSAWDTWTVDILHPAISVTKTADKTKAYAGDVIEYTINVTNIGDCPLYNVNVTDTLFGALLTNGFLGANESITFTKTYTVKAGDEDPLVNTVTVEGEDALGLVVSANASAEVDLIAKICGYKFYDTNMT
ncbi:MAG: hypothetical protein QXQ50_09530 [Candidatus Bathyarchaeia archaeon]